MSKPTFAKKPVVVELDGNEFTFNPTVADANNYINELTVDNKVIPAMNYLKRTVEPDQKELLTEYINQVPGLAMELYAKVSTEARGDIKITLKN